jgi:hypothetical protein
MRLRPHSRKYIKGTHSKHFAVNILVVAKKITPKSVVDPDPSLFCTNLDMDPDSFIIKKKK